MLGPGYGTLACRALNWAKPRFTPQRTRWVSTELWHPRQRGAFDADGFYVLEVPYADHREPLMDILKFGTEFEVLGPDELRQIVGDEARRLARATHSSRSDTRHHYRNCSLGAVVSVVVGSSDLSCHWGSARSRSTASIRRRSRPSGLTARFA